MAKGEIVRLVPFPHVGGCVLTMGLQNGHVLRYDRSVCAPETQVIWLTIKDRLRKS